MPTVQRGARGRAGLAARHRRHHRTPTLPDEPDPRRDDRARPAAVRGHAVRRGRVSKLGDATPRRPALRPEADRPSPLSGRPAASRRAGSSWRWRAGERRGRRGSSPSSTTPTTTPSPTSADPWRRPREPGLRLSLPPCAATRLGQGRRGGQGRRPGRRQRLSGRSAGSPRPTPSGRSWASPPGRRARRPSASPTTTSDPGRRSTGPSTVPPRADPRVHRTSSRSSSASRRAQKSQGPLFVEADGNGTVYCKVYSILAQGTLGDGFPVVPVPSDGLTGRAPPKPLSLDGLEQSVDRTRGTRSNLILNEVTRPGRRRSPSGSTRRATGRRRSPSRTSVLTAVEKVQLSTVFAGLGLDSRRAPQGPDERPLRRHAEVRLRPRLRHRHHHRQQDRRHAERAPHADGRGSGPGDAGNGF